MTMPSKALSIMDKFAYRWGTWDYDRERCPIQQGYSRLNDARAKHNDTIIDGIPTHSPSVTSSDIVITRHLSLLSSLLSTNDSVVG